MNIRTIFLITALTTMSPYSFAADKHNDKSKDAAAVGWLSVVNHNEISVSQEANKRKLDEDVLEYANFMIDEHTKNQQQTEEVAKEEQISALKDKNAEKLEKKGKEGLEKLKGLDDKKFQKEYIKTMIHDHKDALKTIDKKYLPEITNQELKAHFSETKVHVEDHLKKAKELKETLDDKKSS